MRGHPLSGTRETWMVPLSADLGVAWADEREAKVIGEYGQIKAPYTGLITQPNVSPGDNLQPGGGTNSHPLFVPEQTDPV